MYEIEAMLASLTDAAFAPYHQGLRALQLRKKVDTSPHTSNGLGLKSRSRAFSGEQLRTGREQPTDTSVAIITSLSAGEKESTKKAAEAHRMAHPVYAALDHEIAEARQKVRSLGTECSAIERRMLLTPDEKEAERIKDTHDLVAGRLAQALHDLSHLMAYRQSCNVIAPKVHQSRAIRAGEDFLQRRMNILKKAADVSLSREERMSLMRDAEQLFASADRALRKDSSSGWWPGKVNHVVVDPPRTI